MSSSSLNSPLPTIKSLNSSLTKLAETLDPLLKIPFSKLLRDLESGSSQQNQNQSTTDDSNYTSNQSKGKGKKSEDDQKEELGKDKGKGKGKEEEEVNELAGMLDSARLRVSVAYVLLDLIWMYLKTKGIDPQSHPVLGELERVKSYFGKIKAVQLGDQSGDRQAVDKTAADRFIRAALGSQIKNQSSGTGIQPSEGVHKRFDFEKDEEEESDSDDSDDNEDEDSKKRKSKKGKETEKKSKKKNKGKGKKKSEIQVVGEKRSREDNDDEEDEEEEVEVGDGDDDKKVSHSNSSIKLKKKVGKSGRIAPDPFEGAVTRPKSSGGSSMNEISKSEKSGKKKKRKSSGVGGEE